MSRLIDPVFWRTTAGALLRTALAALAPFVPALTTDPAGTWQLAGLTVALAVVVAVGTALRSMPDLTGAPWWEVAFQRALRQFGQMIVAGSAGALVLTDVDWRTVLLAALASAVSTLVLAAIDVLPRPVTPVAVATGPASIVLAADTTAAAPGMTAAQAAAAATEHHTGRAE